MTPTVFGTVASLTGWGYAIEVSDGDGADEAFGAVAGAGGPDVLRLAGVVDGEDGLPGVAQGPRVGQVLRAVVLLARLVGRCVSGAEEQLLHADAVDRLRVAVDVPEFRRVLREHPQ